MKQMQRYQWVVIGVIVVALAFSAMPAQAQRIVNVPQSATVSLDKFINDDSTARKGNPTVYVLARGGYYFTLTAIGNRDGIEIRAAYGSGAAPIVRPGKPATGSSQRSFAPKGNLTLRGLYVVGMDDNTTAPAQITNMVRPTAAGLLLVIDSCHFDVDGGSSIRLDNANNKVFITNSIFSNLGDMNNANGRVLDTRGTAQDTTVIENNIFYNVTEKLLRTGTEGTTGNMVYLRVNQNTIVNCPNNTQWNFGKIKTGYFTNNLTVNSACIGDTSTTGGFIMSDPRNDTPQLFVISNNNWFIDTAITNMYKTIKPPFALFTPRRRNFTDSTATRISAPTRFSNDTIQVAFTKGIAVPTAAVLSQHDTSKYVTNNAKTNLPLAGGSIEYGQTHYVLNLVYSTSSPLYTRGTKGQPLGALLDWKIVLSAGDNRSNAIPSLFALDQNYPNPFNPSTRISYSISQTSQVRLEIFDLLGQSIRLISDMRQQPGSYNVEWDGRDRAGRLLPSGVYLYRLHVDGVALTKKAILMK